MIRSALSLTATLVVVATLSACSDRSPAATEPAGHGVAFAHQARDGAAIGRTDGWAEGKTVTFHYNKDFFCPQPSGSGAMSGCILGEEASRPARPGDLPVLYVTVPLGFTPDESTLQCPVAGDCINHPHTIDLSPVFGAGTENALLPPHSHVVGDDDMQKQGANAGWWEVEVVGVTSQAAWDQLVAGRSLRTVRTLQAGGSATPDIPSNLFLFFSVNSSGK